MFQETARVICYGLRPDLGKVSPPQPSGKVPTMRATVAAALAAVIVYWISREQDPAPEEPEIPRLTPGQAMGYWSPHT